MPRNLFEYLDDIEWKMNERDDKYKQKRGALEWMNSATLHINHIEVQLDNTLRRIGQLEETLENIQIKGEV